MMFRSLLFSCSLLGFLAGSAVMAMEEDENSEPKAIKTKPKDTSPGKLVPFNFETTFPLDIQKLIVQQVVYEQSLENKGLLNIPMLSKNWAAIFKEEMQVNKLFWTTLYGSLTPEQEKIYQTFLKGKLIYRPDPNSDEGKIKLKISDLPNPLGSPFDLSKCGKTGKFLSISTGYRKSKKSENAEKVEVWIAPRFLIETKLQGLAKHFAPIMSKWDEKTAPIGLFFTWGGWVNLDWYDYLTKDSMDGTGSENLLKKYEKSDPRGGTCPGCAPTHLPGFHISFVN